MDPPTPGVGGVWLLAQQGREPLVRQRFPDHAAI